MLEAGASGPRAPRRFAITFFLLFACVGAWSIATPMFGSADEQVHMVTAYATVHGVEGRTNAEDKQEYAVPSVYTGETICYAFRPESSASCLFFDSSAPDHTATSTADSYPPFYYLLVGWPSLLHSGLTGLYLMRLMAAVWTALFVALALHSLDGIRSRVPLLLGATICLTPAVLSFGGAVNPTGLSLAAAIAVWCGGIALTRTDQLVRPAHSLARVGAPLCALLLIRRDSVVWAGLICMLLVLITPAERRQQLARSRDARLWAAAAVISAALQLWLSGASTAQSVVTAGDGSLADTWAELHLYVNQMGGGILGWLDTRLPEFVYDVFTYGPALLALVGACVARRRVGVAIAAVTSLALGAPLAIGTIRYGYVQGRYVLPLAFGVPLLGSLAVAERLRGRRFPPAVAMAWLGVLWISGVAAFAQVLRRFTTGAHGGWWFTSEPTWEPPVVSTSAWFTLFCLALGALLSWTYVLFSAGERGSEGRHLQASVHEPVP